MTLSKCLTARYVTTVIFNLYRAMYGDEREIKINFFRTHHVGKNIEWIENTNEAFYC